MGLSSKQVSSDSHGWSQSLLQGQALELPKPLSMKRQQQQQQSQQQQPEQLKCPRCESSNTKFCYYNNYNKLQPRHFCKSCKRHWTKGGTLRNVPVGGGRKNKRLKTSTSSNKITTTSLTTPTTTSNCINGNFVNMEQQRENNLGFSLGLSHPLLPSSSSIIQLQNTNQALHFAKFGDVNDPISCSVVDPYSSSSSFETRPISSPISTNFQTSNAFNFNGDRTIEDPSIISSVTQQQQPWQVVPDTSCSGTGMDYNWNWDDIETFVSTDLNMAWDDSDIKP